MNTHSYFPPHFVGVRYVQEGQHTILSGAAISGLNMALLQHPFSIQRNPLRTVITDAGNRGTLSRSRTAPSTVALLPLNPPPYKLDALEPHMSKWTLEVHWGKHHRAYVDNLNKQIEGTELDGYPLHEIIKTTYNNGDPLPAFNNAAQAWNHEFFWDCMKPGGGKKPTGEVLKLIERDFGSYDEFLKEFKQAAATQFGSGWAWLVLKDDKLAVEKSPNAVNPIVWGHIPLLTIDVWEHAYYLDYQNRRPDYISVFVNELVSWDAVNARLDSVTASVKS